MRRAAFIVALFLLTLYAGVVAGRTTHPANDCQEDQVWDWTANDLRACVTVDDRYVELSRFDPFAMCPPRVPLADCPATFPND